MAGPVTNPTASLYDQVQITGAHARGANRQAQDASASDWFMPGIDVDLKSSIEVKSNPDFQGGSPDSVASQVVSNVGA